MVYSTHRLSDLLSHSFLSLLGPSRVQVFHLLFLESFQINLERADVLIKQQLIKLSTEIRLSWPSLSPLPLPISMQPHVLLQL